MKMYFLVLYNLSPIQQGIQAGHCALEYVNKYRDSKNPQGSLLKTFVKTHKTFVVLNGGTTYSMHDHLMYLQEQDIPHVTFEEPDLGGITTCIGFLDKGGDRTMEYFTRNFKLA